MRCVITGRFQPAFTSADTVLVHSRRQGRRHVITLPYGQIAGSMCLGPNLTHPGRLAFRTLFPECWRFGSVSSSPHFERIKYGVHRTLLRLKASPISFLLRHPHSPFIRCSCSPSDSNPRQPFYQICVVVHPTPHNCPTRILRVTVRRRHSPATRLPCSMAAILATCCVVQYPRIAQTVKMQCARTGPSPRRHLALLLSYPSITSIFRSV